MKTMMNEEMVANLKRDFDFETLVQLNGLIEDYKDLAEEYNQKIEFDYEMQVFDDSLNRAVKERCDELINAEKKVKELSEDDSTKDELDIKFADEARELVKSLVEKYNGKTIKSDVMKANDRITKQILDLKSFKNSIEVIETAQRCLKNRTVDEETADKLIFINYLAIWDVLNMIREKDWTDIEDFKILNEEDIPVKDHLLDYINSNIENGLETDADTVEWLVQCGFDDIYVRFLEDENEDIYLCLFDGNENRLTDCYMDY
ncbi:hypothetical protein [Clostridium botulinum]|nr:hypothetical protein [Clostridium botulinum]MBY6822278.1 hypothetical protein [Clostridium botulinum]MBY6832932.1 hypothetical protein [Clostridium botulinum]MBY6972160.1 hypothetical protein [Clostridium botulinum]HBJ1649395.1 hypothetical protein [Clostridium botulinum]